MNQRHVSNTKDGSIYVFTTTTKAEAFGLDNDTPTVTAFIHAQTEYVNSLNTFIEVNDAVQSAAEHLALTQIEMKAGIKVSGKESAEAIIREMNNSTTVKLLVPCYQTKSQHM